MADNATNTTRGKAIAVDYTENGTIYELPDGERVIVRKDVVRANGRFRFKVQAFRLDSDGDVEDWGDPCHTVHGDVRESRVIESMGYTVEAT